MLVRRLFALLVTPRPLLRTVLPRRADEVTVANQPPHTADVHAALFPLINGPRFLPAHVAVRINDSVYDFVPADPTARETLGTLIKGRPVPGIIRSRPAARGCRISGDGDGDGGNGDGNGGGGVGTDAPFATQWRYLGRTRRLRDEIESFAREQPSELALSSNNCWHFAAALVSFALSADAELAGD